MATLIQHPDRPNRWRSWFTNWMRRTRSTRAERNKKKARWKPIRDKNHIWLGHQRSTRKIKYNFLQHCKFCQSRRLDKQFQNFCNLEFNDVDQSNKPSLSQEDHRALHIMSSSAKLNDGHYEIALSWKKVPPDMPNNKPIAERRLDLLKRRLDKDPLLKKKYSEFIEDLLKKEYARKVPDEQVALDGNAWYLPHHPVFHSQKPEKIRVVFDCSAKYRGTSLNDQLLQGPDLTNSLIGVLTRFRRSSIAFMADIEAMFHQVRVPPKDCNALRLLWWPNSDTTATPEEYQMMVHLFGGISSPSCANFALKKTAEDNLILLLYT